MAEGPSFEQEAWKQYSKEAQSFVSSCLKLAVSQRKSPQELLASGFMSIQKEKQISQEDKDELRKNL